MPDNILEVTENFVRKRLEKAEAGHDWWHIYRVLKLTRKILESEKADSLVCEMGALLHDISDHKFHEKQSGEEITRKFLADKYIDKKRKEKILDIVRNISFKGGVNEEAHKTPELKIVQDADRLDAMGATGIARTFHYGGFRNRKIYDPRIKPIRYKSAEEYLKSDAPTINHFYEKLLLLKDLMNTETGRSLAENRHRFMLRFLDHFYDEWEGNS